MATTHINDIAGTLLRSSTPPAAPLQGDEYWDTTQHAWCRYSGTNWLIFNFTTSSTSTSTSTSTSSSTSTTSTSSSTSTTTSTSTSTSTTTTG